MRLSAAPGAAQLGTNIGHCTEVDKCECAHNNAPICRHIATTLKGRGHKMTGKERIIAALERRPPSGRVPHFELVFFLTMEAFGRLHPRHRCYDQWDQMEEKERELHRRDMAEVYIATARRFEHDAVFFQLVENSLLFLLAVPALEEVIQ